MTRVYKPIAPPQPRPCVYCGRIYQPSRSTQSNCQRCSKTAYNDRSALRRNAIGQGAEYVRCLRDDPGGLYRAGTWCWRPLVRQDCAMGQARLDSFDWEAA